MLYLSPLSLVRYLPLVLSYVLSSFLIPGLGYYLTVPMSESSLYWGLLKDKINFFKI